jgi:hypothetical protein
MMVLCAGRFRWFILGLVAALFCTCQRDHENPFDPTNDPFSLRILAGEAHIGLRWDVLPASPSIEGVAIERKSAGEESFVGLDSVPRADTSYIDYQVVAGTAYAYRLRPFRDGEFGASSKQVSGTPTALRAPSDLTAKDYPGDAGGAILLQWTAAPADTQGGSLVVGYEIRRSLQELQDYSVIDSTVAGESSYVDSAANYVTFYYKVAALARYAVSGFSLVASARCSSDVQLQPPTNLQASDVPDDQGTAAQLTWSLSPGDIPQNPDFEGYSLFRASGGSQYALVAEVPARTSAYADTTVTAGVLYSYRAKSRGFGGLLSDGYAEDSVVPVDNIAPAGPTDLAAGDTPGDQGGSISLTWGLSPDDGGGAADVLRYGLYRGESDQPAEADSIVEVAAGVSAYVDAGLPDGQTYYYWLRAWDTANGSDLAGPSSASALDNLAPAPPTSVQARDNPGDGGGAILLEWDLSADDGSGANDVVEYRLFRSEESGSYPQEPLLAVSAGTTTSIDSTAVDTLAYYYALRAWDGSNLSDLSDEDGPAQSADDLPPGRVTDLDAEGGPGEGDATVSWTAPAEDSLAGGPVDEYDLRYSNEPIETEQDFQAATEVQGEPTPADPGLAQSMVVGGLLSGELYYFAIRSTDDVGLVSAVSNVDSAIPGADNTPPAAVGDLAAQPGRMEGEVKISWTAPGDDGTTGGPAAEYDLRYDTLPFDDEGFALADTIPGVPPPGQPGDTDSVTIGGLQGGNRYYFRLKTRDDAGNWSAISNLASSEALGDTIPPAKVTNLVAVTGIQENEVKLTWTAPGDDSLEGTAEKYAIRYSSGQIVTETDWLNATPVPEGQITPPLAGGSPETLLVYAYLPGDIGWFALRAEDDAGNISAISNTDSTMIQGDVTAPGTISDLVVSTGDNEGDVQLQWQAPHEDGPQGGAVTEYEIRRHDLPITGINWADATQIANPPPPLPPGQTHTFTVAGLVAGKLYYFAIKSADEVPNWSAVSNSDSAYARPDVTAPAEVLDFTATAGETSVQLTWTNPGDGDVQGTELRYSTQAFPNQPWEGTFLDLVWGGPNETKTYVHTAGVVPKTTHYYAAFAYDDAYPDPNYSAAEHDSATPGDFVPPGPVTQFVATGLDTTVRLTWVNPTDSDFVGTRVRYSTTGYPPSPTSGTLVTDEPGLPGQPDSCLHTGLENGQVYYYSAFAYDDALPQPNYSTTAGQDEATPADTTAPASVVSFTAAWVVADTVRLTWQNPATADFEGTVICYDTADYPPTPHDGTVLIDLPGEPGGSETRYHDGVESGETYYYSAFAYDEVPNYAPAAQDTAEVP